jgi:hypothetical protein
MRSITERAAEAGRRMTRGVLPALNAELEQMLACMPVPDATNFMFACGL